MVCDRPQPEASAGRDELLLDLDAAAYQVDGTVVVDPSVGCILAENSAPCVADADLGDFGDESVHTLHAATVRGDDLAADSGESVINARERVREVDVLSAESVEKFVQPKLVEMADPGRDCLLLRALCKLPRISHRRGPA